MDYDEYELNAVIKEEHDALQKTKVFTRVCQTTLRSNSKTSYRQNVLLDHDQEENRNALKQNS
eukprot:6490888-Amphidinium_carterae.3